MKVPFELESFAGDRQSYQPYKPVFKPVSMVWMDADTKKMDLLPGNRLIVEVEVDSKEVRKEGDSFIFTPKGLEIAIQEVAKIFDRVHQQYLQELD